MDALGWDSCDIIIVTGDAYVDHLSFGMAIIDRLRSQANNGTSTSVTVYSSNRLPKSRHLDR